MALIRVASLVPRAAAKHSLESSGARRRKGPVHKYWRAQGLPVFVHRLALTSRNTDIWRALLSSRVRMWGICRTLWCMSPTNPLDKRVPDTGDLCSFILAAPFYTARRARAYQSSTCSSSASAIRAAPFYPCIVPRSSTTA